MDSGDRNDFIYDKLDGTPDRFIKSIINKYYETLRYCEGVGYADLIQEGWIALMNVAKKYISNQENEAKYSTLAYWRVEGRIKDIIRKEIKNKHAEGQYNQEIFADSVEKVAHVSKEFDELSEQEQSILELYAEGHTIREIAKQPNIDVRKSRVHEVLKNIKNQTGQNAPNLR